MSNVYNGPIGMYPNSSANVDLDIQAGNLPNENFVEYPAQVNYEEQINNQQIGGDKTVGDKDINEDQKLMSLFDLLKDLKDTNSGINLNQGFSPGGEGSASGSNFQSSFDFGQQLKGAASLNPFGSKTT